MRHITWQERLRYSFDNSMSRGPIALIGWLFLASALIIFVIALIVWLTGAGFQVDEQGNKTYYNFWDLSWMGLMRTLDITTCTGCS